MKHLQQNWKTRTSLVLIVSVLISLLLVTLELTDWAAQINQQGYSHGAPEGEQPNIPSFLMYILPFIKELILMGVPMFLTLGIAKLIGLTKRRFNAPR